VSAVDLEKFIAGICDEYVRRWQNPSYHDESYPLLKPRQVKLTLTTLLDDSRKARTPRHSHSKDKYENCV